MFAKETLNKVKETLRTRQILRGAEARTILDLCKPSPTPFAASLGRNAPTISPLQEYDAI